MLVGDTGGVFGARSVRHLVTMRGNSTYASIPLELLNDDGKMNLSVETALVPSGAEIPLTDQTREWMSSGYETKVGTGEVHINPDRFNRTIYDRVPEIGFISVVR